MECTGPFELDMISGAGRVLPQECFCCIAIHEGIHVDREPGIGKDEPQFILLPVDAISPQDIKTDRAGVDGIDRFDTGGAAPA